MVATAFWLFLIWLFGTGVILLIAGILMLVFGKRRANRTGKKSALRIAGIVITIVSAIMIAVPTVFLLYTRHMNGQVDSDYVETGTMVVWNHDEGYLTYEGARYIKADYDDGIIEMRNTLSHEGKEHGDPEFNVRNEATFITVLFNGFNKTTAFDVANSGNFDRYYCGRGLLCRESDKDAMIAHYDEPGKTNWTFEIEANGEIQESYVLALSEEEISQLENLPEVGTQQMIRKNNDNPPEGERYFHIAVTTDDEIFSGTLYLTLINDALYWISDEQTDDNYEHRDICYRLPESINSELMNYVK